MKQTLFFLTSAAVLLLTLCTKVNFNNPLDANGGVYAGDSLSGDHDGDGIANKYDLDFLKEYDKTPPVITFSGGIGNHDTVIFRQGDPEGVLTTKATVSATDNISSPDKITITNSGLFTSQCGVQPVTYTATDQVGNSSTKMRIIIVDCDPPVITLAGDNPVNLQVGGTYTEPGATAADNIDGPVTFTTAGTVRTNNEHIDTITYTARDRAGNVATKKRLVVISQAPDTDPPTITLKGNNPFTLSEGTPYTEPGWTATDIRDGDLTSQVVVTGGPVVTTIAGRDTLTYSVSDKAGNPAVVKRIIIITPIGPVVDTIKPDITLKGALSIQVPVNGVYTEPGWVATDNVDGDLTNKVKVSELDNKPLPVNTSAPATYNLVYSVTDSAGNTRTVSREVRVVGGSTDTVKPVILLEGAVQCTVKLGSSFVEPGATATDNPDGVISDKITKVVKNAAGAVASITPATIIGNYTITYSVSDKAGNAAVPKVRNVYCKDTFVDPNDLLNKYGVPLTTSLPTFTKDYTTSITTDGTGAPNMGTVKSFTLGWRNDPNSKGLDNFACQTTGGYLDLKGKITHTFDQVNPGFTLTGSGITGLDGAYYIKANATQCVWVTKDGKFAIVFK